MPGGGTDAEVRRLVEAAAAGSVRATARLLTRIESGGDAAAQIAEALVGRPRSARLIGVTGPPGVGKSTLVAALIGRFRGFGLRVAVLAIDPSSPFTGGALLGDRVRMAGYGTDPAVFIRSMASRGHLGGLSAAAPAAADLFSALGYDVLLVETVGVGQNEVSVMQLADTVLLVLAPGMGDGVQAAKAGILEIADVLLVNKSDREGAPEAVRELRAMVALGRTGTAESQSWRPPVLSSVASEGVGIDEIGATLDHHHDFLVTHGAGTDRRRRRAEVAIRSALLERLDALLASPDALAQIAGAAADVAAGTNTHHRAAAAVLAWMRDRIDRPPFRSGSASG